MYANAPLPTQTIKARSQLIQSTKIRSTEHHTYSGNFLNQLVLNVKENGFSHRYNMRFPPPSNYDNNFLSPQSETSLL